MIANMKAAMIREAGGPEVLRIESLSVPVPQKGEVVLELVGTTTLKDSLRCAKQRGIVCMTGNVGNQWAFDNFAPMEAIPTAVCLTSYAGESEDFTRTPLEELAARIAARYSDSKTLESVKVCIRVKDGADDVVDVKPFAEAELEPMRTIY